MNEFKALLSKLGHSDRIKSRLYKMNESLDLIKSCFVILVLLAGLTVFLTEWL